MGGHLQGGRQRRCLEVVEVWGGGRGGEDVCVVGTTRGSSLAVRLACLCQKKKKKKKRQDSDKLSSTRSHRTLTHARTHRHHARLAHQKKKKKKKEWLATV